MPKPLSQDFINIFEKNKIFFNKLITDDKFVGAYDVRKHFEEAEDYEAPIEEFRLFYGKNWENLDKKGMRDKADSLYGAMQTAEQTYIEKQREEQRLLNNSNGYDEYEVQQFNSSATDYQTAYIDVDKVENKLAQKEIKLFGELVQSANLPDFSNTLQGNISIQNAIQAKDTFPLLQALLEEIAAQQGDNQALQSLSKALMTAHLLLNKPVFEEGSTYIQLLGFLLQQEPVNEDLLLEAIKLQVKICLLTGDDLAATQEFLNKFLAFKDCQGEENTPILSESFFSNLNLLLKGIDQYPYQDIQLLKQFRGLDKAKELFNPTFLNEEQGKQRLIFVRSYTKDLLLIEPVDSQQLPVETADSHDEQVTVTPKPLQLNELYKDRAQSDTEQAKRDFTFKLLEDAKQITANTKGQSREDLDQLLSLIKDKYYSLETDEYFRKAFRADLITKAVEGLVFSKKILPLYRNIWLQRN